MFEGLNQFVESHNISDFSVEAFNSVDLEIIGSFDLCYYYDVKIVFCEVSYISLPTRFQWPLFRTATATEINAVSACIALEEEDQVFCIEAETGKGLERHPFFVVAQSFRIEENHVSFVKSE